MAGLSQRTVVTVLSVSDRDGVRTLGHGSPANAAERWYSPDESSCASKKGADELDPRSGVLGWPEVEGDGRAFCPTHSEETAEPSHGSILVDWCSTDDSSSHVSNEDAAELDSHSGSLGWSQVEGDGRAFCPPSMEETLEPSNLSSFVDRYVDGSGHFIPLAAEDVSELSQGSFISLEHRPLPEDVRRADHGDDFADAPDGGQSGRARKQAVEHLPVRGRSQQAAASDPAAPAHPPTPRRSPERHNSRVQWGLVNSALASLQRMTSRTRRSSTSSVGHQPPRTAWE